MKPVVDLGYGHRFLTDSSAVSELEFMDIWTLEELDSEGKVGVEKDITTSSDWEPQILDDFIRKSEVDNWDDYLAFRRTIARINGELTCDI